MKIGAEQADYRGLKPWDEARFIASRVWAGVRWPFALALRVARRNRNADEA